jgi:hypothetical protein
MIPHNGRRSVVRVILLTTLIGGFLYLGGCRKPGAENGTEIPGAKDIPAWVLENIKKMPKSFIVPVNKKSPGIFLDQNGEERPANYFKNLFASGNRTLTIPCDPFEDDFEDNIFSFNYVEVQFYGYNTAGFKVYSEFILSTGFNILANQPGDPTKLTSGRVRVRDIATNTILHTFTDIPMTYINEGPDPSNGQKTLYKLKFTTPLINDPNVNIMNVYFEVRPIVYTDCDEVIITTNTWQSQPIGLIGAAICSRVDNIGIQPAGSGVVYISGCVAGASTYPPGVGVPHQQQVQYDDGSGSGWVTPTFPTDLCTQSSNLMPFDAWPISVIPGTVKFRWRNIMHDSNNCSPNYQVVCQGPFHEISMVVP